MSEPTQKQLSIWSVGALRDHASQSVAPGSEKARKMTAGSGAKLSRSLNVSGPVGACLKILLASETWGSTESFLSWKVSATPSGRLIYRLVPSTPRTSGNGIGSSHVWPTVVANDDNKTPEAHLRMKANMPGGPRKEITSLQVMALATWPTPIDMTAGSRDHRSKDRKDEMLMGGLVRATWSTPAAQTAGCSEEIIGKGLDDQRKYGGQKVQMTLDRQIFAQHGANTSGLHALTEKFAEHLILLSAWMMGQDAALLRLWPKKAGPRDRS